MGVRAALRRGRAELSRSLGLHARALRALDGSRALILMYHRVLPAANARERAVEPGMYVSPETFRAHLRWLREDFRPLPLHEIVSALEARRPLPARAVALTFDDGWRDNLLHALPALEAEGVPATVFLVADRVGTLGSFWPDEVAQRLAPLRESERRDRLAALGLAAGRDASQAMIAWLKHCGEAERERLLGGLRARTPAPTLPERELLGWDEVDRMARAGVDFESHGASHAILTDLAPEGVRDDLERARRRLRERGHGRHDLLAYPSGAYDASVRETAKACGYRGAVTVDTGAVALGSDVLSLPRIGLHEDVSRSRAEFLHRLLAHAGGDPLSGPEAQRAKTSAAQSASS